jgi:hypothetical protein
MYWINIYIYIKYVYMNIYIYIYIYIKYVYMNIYIYIYIYYTIFQVLSSAHVEYDAPSCNKQS